MRHLVRGAFAAAALLAGLGAPAMAAENTDGDKLTVAESEKYGPYVADAQGRALYMFEPDERGQGKEAARSTCYAACAEAWPPLLAQGDPEPELGDRLESGLLNTTKRQNGSLQVTYGGWPLYYFVKDQGSGSVAGQDVHGFGGGWYLVGPDGNKIEQEG